MADNGQREWWPDHPRRVFDTIRDVMRSDRLYPNDLQKLSKDVGAILPNQSVILVHVSGKELASRKGRYDITIEGPVFAGKWSFRSGDLEKQMMGSTSHKS